MDKKEHISEDVGKTAARYSQALYKQLLAADTPDSPILQEFTAWVKKMNGFKTLEDIKNDNNLEYYIFLFLCEHNIIFRLTVQNRFDLLLEFLTALTAKHRTPRDPRDRDQNKQSMEELPSALSKTTTPVEDVFAHLKALESAKIQFEVWCTLHKALKELKHEHLVAQRENRRDAAAALTPILDKMYSEIDTDEDEDDFDIAFRAAIAALQKRHQARVHEMDRECGKTKQTPSRVRASAQRTIALFNEGRNDIFGVMDAHPERTAVHRRASQKICSEYDNAFSKINKKYNTLIAMLEVRVEELCTENKATQKKYLEKVGELASEIQREFRDNLDGNQKHAFAQFQQKLGVHVKAIEQVKNPEDLQAILGACAQDLTMLIRPLQKNPNMRSGIVALEETQKILHNFAYQKPEKHHLWQKNSSGTCVASEIEALQQEHPLSKQSPASELGRLFLATDISDTADTTSGISLNRFGDSPPRDVSLQKEAKITLQGMRAEKSTDGILALMNDIQKKFEEAKEDEEDPISASEEEIQAINKLIEGLQRSAREANSLDSSDLEELQDKIDKLQIKHPENNALPEVAINLAKLTSQPQNKNNI